MITSSDPYVTYSNVPLPTLSNTFFLSFTVNINLNYKNEVAETEIIIVKMAETLEVVKSVENFWNFSGGTHPKIL